MFLRFSALAVASLAVTGAALADGVTVTQKPVIDGARSTTVQIGDLDLAKPQGQATLERRVRAAARSVCEGGDLRDTRAFVERNSCVKAAVEDAMRQVAPAVAGAQAPEKAG